MCNGKAWMPGCARVTWVASDRSDVKRLAGWRPGYRKSDNTSPALAKIRDGLKKVPQSRAQKWSLAGADWSE
jgi:hypothetical protein